MVGFGKVPLRPYKLDLGLLGRGQALLWRPSGDIMIVKAYAAAAMAVMAGTAVVGPAVAQTPVKAPVKAVAKPAAPSSQASLAKGAKGSKIILYGPPQPG